MVPGPLEDRLPRSSEKQIWRPLARFTSPELVLPRLRAAAKATARVFVVSAAQAEVETTAVPAVEKGLVAIVPRVVTAFSSSGGAAKVDNEAIIAKVKVAVVAIVGAAVAVGNSTRLWLSAG
eukprot:SAG31_NODE_657_length_13108_cov_3.079330_8_plen_122_part_00